MSKQLQKSLLQYLAKIRRETGKIQLSTKSFSSTKNWVLPKSCKHPRTPSFFVGGKKKKRSGKSKTKNKSKARDDETNGDGIGDHAATLSDIDRFLEENFKSLCVRDGHDDDDDESVDVNAHRERDLIKMMNKKPLEESDDSDDDDDDEDDHHRFRRAWAPALYDSPKMSETSLGPRKSRNLFMAAGAGSSEEMPPSIATTTVPSDTSSEAGISSISNSSVFRNRCPPVVLPDNCIAVLQYTPDPQEDFRRSMLEMVEAKLGIGNSEVGWEYMEELLFCYLDLNDKKSHPFILSAFVDLVVVLRQHEKSITGKEIMARSVSSRTARERLRRRMKRP